MQNVSKSLIITSFLSSPKDKQGCKQLSRNKPKIYIWILKVNGGKFLLNMTSRKVKRLCEKLPNNSVKVYKEWWTMFDVYNCVFHLLWLKWKKTFFFSKLMLILLCLKKYICIRFIFQILLVVIYLYVYCNFCYRNYRKSLFTSNYVFLQSYDCWLVQWHIGWVENTSPPSNQIQKSSS